MSIERARLQLIDAQPFYASVLQNCLFSWDERVKTAGVGVDSQGRVRLYVARSFWDSLSEEHQVGLLMHEMLHLILAHLTRGEDLDKKIANIAMDVALNQYIPQHLLPPGALLPETFKLERNQNFQFYYLKLLEDQKANSSKTLDNHDELDGLHGENEEGSNEKGEEEKEGSGLSKELKEAAISDAVSKALQGTKPGDVPQVVKNALEEKEREQSKTAWKNILKKYMGRFLSRESESTRIKPNRRMGLKAPGQKRTESPNVMIACDQSGSMTDDMVLSVMNEAKAILKHLSEKTEVIYFDVEVAHKETLSKITKVERYTSGGTDFDCAVEYANQKRPDCLVILTDGEADLKVKAKMPIIWVICSRSSDPNVFSHLKGEKIFVKAA